MATRDAPARTVTFTGVPSGDGECFYWLVDAKTFRRLTGRRPGDFDGVRGAGYILYPGRLIPDALQNSPCKVTVTVEAAP